MNTIVIDNLRRIRHLEFNVPWKRGVVYLLTGTNGSGKSTLLTCLARLDDPLAFEKSFRPNIMFAEDDGNVYAEATICYRHEDVQATFFCDTADGKWKTESAVDTEKMFTLFAYPRVHFAGARRKNESITGKRFQAEQVRPAEKQLSAQLQGIFDDEKFGQLFRMRLEDSGEELFLVRERIRGRDFYFSENNFSAGERSVVHLLDELQRLPGDSMVLIDEAEMALHPKAQKRLQTMLEHIAAEKNLTVLMSTHSATLIKTTDPRRLLFLDCGEDGTIQCRRNVYPAEILGEMAIAEEILPETILLVEDSEAAMLLEAIINKLKTVLAADFPYCKILPVGGYMQVVILLDNLSRVLPPFVHRRAVLDRDAEYNIRKAAGDSKRAHFDVVSRNLERIYFLPSTPEQGVIRMLEADPKRHSRELAEALESPPFRLLDMIHGNPEYRAIGGSSRSDCKDKLSLLVEHIMQISGEPEQSVRKKLYRYYVDQNYSDAAKLKEDYCGLIFKR